jgi:hypothetical protein
MPVTTPYLDGLLAPDAPLPGLTRPSIAAQKHSILMDARGKPGHDE